MVRASSVQPLSTEVGIMVDLSKLNLNDEPVSEISHEFEIDLHYLVTANYKITLEGIEREEREDMASTKEHFANETDHEMVSAVLSSYQQFFDDLRAASRNLTAVGLVTRFQHWASACARRIDPQRERGLSLQKELNFLEATLGLGPVSTEFFGRLAEVRHSVIHADSQPQWKYLDKVRHVEPKYAPNGYRVEISEEDLRDAIEKAIVQIKWYDEKLLALHK
jgi:hypothetical protein